MSELIAIILSLLAVINAGPRDFASVEELQTFLAEDTSDRTVYLKPDSNGVVHLKNYCEDMAFKLRSNALKKGFWLDTEYMPYAEVVKKYPDAPRMAHMLNKAVIGNDVYYVEPDTDEIWFAFNLD